MLCEFTPAETDAVQYTGKVEKENRQIVKSIKSDNLYQNSGSCLRELKCS